MSFYCKNKGLFKEVCTFVCGLVVGGVGVYLLSQPEHKTCAPTENDESCETMYSQVYGIDVSYWQGHMDWDQLRLPCEEDGRVSGKIPVPHNRRPVQFTFIRTTKGDTLVDAHYQRNYNEAKRLGIPRGAYHFLTNSASGKVQAELFLSHVIFEPGDLPPVLDVEIDSPAIVAKAKEWLAAVEDSCGTKAIVYSNMNVYNKWIKGDPILSTRDLWLAKPRGEMPTEPNCQFWQFTHEGHVWGIIDNVVDINMFNGTQQELQDYIQAKGIKNNYNK